MARIERAPVSGLESRGDFKPGEFYEHLPTGDIYMAVDPPSSRNLTGYRGGRHAYSYESETEFCESYGWAESLVHVATGTLRPVEPEENCHPKYRWKPSDFAPIPARVTVDPSPRRASGPLTAEFIDAPASEEAIEGAEPDAALDGAPQPAAIKGGGTKRLKP